MPIGISTKVGLFSHDVNARKNLAVIGDLVLEPYVAYVPLMFQNVFGPFVPDPLMFRERNIKKSWDIARVRGRRIGKMRRPKKQKSGGNEGQMKGIEGIVSPCNTISY